MNILKTAVHPDLGILQGKSQFKRIATRAICLNKEEILLLYTERYHDYSLPGGGLDKGEDIVEGLKRELIEETGAQNIRNIKPFGVYEEFRPWYKPDFDIQHIFSYCYVCTIDSRLGETSHEDYEVDNGMSPLWINIHEAIRRNEETQKNSPKKGMSIERETFLLKLIAKELL